MTSFQHSDVYYEDNDKIYVYEHDLFGDSFGGSTNSTADDSGGKSSIWESDRRYNFDDDNRLALTGL